MGCGPSTGKNKAGSQPKQKHKAYKGQGYAVGGGENDNADQRELRAQAAEKRLQQNNQKGFNKASYAEMERKKKLQEEMEKDRLAKGDGANMKWNMK
ncbi:unnamed protein product [Moneuplotes crassus]|uniref:Uncharacterized protein n=1 Tax=Euplotes crassus TaxID=5936 RepID=A0AAD1Y2F0_EUPCR|nr:unnamed protein product [Moneuplotes crassus]CAI2383047.1 unnamed protein product [Moneuplotes crassus]